MFYPKSAAGPLKAVDIPKTISPFPLVSFAGRGVVRERKRTITILRKHNGVIQFIVFILGKIFDFGCVEHCRSFS
jgi:hypothetical protein